MDKFERFINWGNDLTWGPFEFLRPPKTANMDVKLITQICAISIAAIIVMALLVVLLIQSCSINAHYGIWPTMQMFIRMAVTLIMQIWWLLAIAATAFPIFWSPGIYCWNRRAARLRQAAEADVDAPNEGVWPPAPRKS